MNRSQRAFTIVELIIVVALVAIVASLAGPSLHSLILMQRLRSINANLVTDLQYARSEAVSRGKNVWVQFKMTASNMTCYTIYSDQSNTKSASGLCDCTQVPASRCPASSTELKTVQIPLSQSVSINIDTAGGTPVVFAFDPITGSIYVPPTDVAVAAAHPPVVDLQIDSGRVMRTRISPSGRPSVCIPSGSVVTGGYPAC